MSSDVAVWRVPLDPARAPEARALAELSRAELDRAALFATDALRHRWLHAHVALRRILAIALDVPPSAIAYRIGAAGKPSLAPIDGAAATLEFNLSDSADLALVAVSRHGPVGVDVEQCRAQRDLATLARSFFAPEEHAAIAALAGDAQRAAFYRVWARKEAFIKAIGDGIAHGLTRFAVSHGTEAPRLLRADRVADLARDWALADVPTPDGYVGAVVARPPFTITMHDWPG